MRVSREHCSPRPIALSNLRQDAGQN